eukprot:7617872-Alexandrium_andersonii.AAC.1
MSASLVGSEMCIRDRTDTDADLGHNITRVVGTRTTEPYCNRKASEQVLDCLLYTSDAADDM